MSFYSSKCIWVVAFAGATAIVLGTNNSMGQDSFAADKAAWGPDSDNAKTLAKLLGGTAEQQAAALKNLTLLTPEVQASDAWLGGGEKSGAAKILKDTATFLKEQGKVSEVLPNYGNFVTADALNNATN
ncbi:hypothetical protein AJ87_11665 [Rhizobium yanglingense]|nr:hypothetical protein AJ87_11665 [Rhizobium yanglingense]